ncbi:MAG: putative oxidoreductase EphD [Acidimicrobiales bacterium]|jgi:2-hydroxycyclohexanecarboxyl-CoA dehydrogenase|nr:putative oxidoreductase EphD [Acidimicrobiales bacterium]
MGRVTLPGALVLVTGAGSGIGRATALAFADAGARIIAVDVDGAAAEKTAAACAELGVQAEARHGDVTDYDAVTALAATVDAEHGAVDVLVNNAGVGLTGRMLATSIEDWRWIRSVNLDGVVHCLYAFAPAMLARGRGHVVNVSSGLGYTPHASEPAYVATKAAVLALSQSLRADWGTSGVGVSAICPGVINTPIAANTRYRGRRADPKERAQVERMFRRGHKPERVAAAIVKAVERDRAVVPVGFEAHAGWWFHRLAPLALQQRLARAQSG